MPQRPDRPRQRAGDRRPLRALRRAGGGAPAGAVVLPDHRVRRPAARGHARHRVAPAREDDAGELDRPLGGRRGHVPLRGARDRLPGLHDASRHALRRDLLRDGARAPRRPPDVGHAGGPRLRQPRDQRAHRGARGRAQGEDRGGSRPHRHEPGERRGDPGLRGRLRAHGVRHRRDHGGARPRHARLRVRRALRHRDQASDRGRRGAAVHRRRPDGEARAASTACTTARPTTRSSTGSRRRARVTARSTTGCATGCSRGSATGAARSRSSTATSAGSCRSRTTSCRCASPT